MPGVPSSGTAPRRSRAEWHARFSALREQGFTCTMIARGEGVGHTFVSSVLRDPTGDWERERKNRYRGRCETCGKPTDGSNGAAKAPRFCNVHIGAAMANWDRDRCVASIRAFHQMFGVWPRATDFSPALGVGKLSPERLALTLARNAAGDWPHVHTVRRYCGSWNAAIVEAGGRPYIGLRQIGAGA